MSGSVLSPGAPSDQIERAFLRTSSVGFLRTILAVPVYLALTPFILRSIGQEMFGLWSINTIVTTALLLVDFGFQNSLVHFTALHLGNPRKLSELFNTVLLAVGASTSACFLAIACLRGTIIHGLFGIPVALHSEGVFVLITTAAGFCFRLLSVPYQALIEGHQRTDYTQKVFLTWMLFHAAATVIGLRISPTVYSLSLVSLLGNVLIALLFIRDARHRYPFAAIEPGRCRLATLGEILPYVLGMHAATILVLAREPLIKTVVARTFGLSDLASFEIAYRLTVQCMSFAAVPLLTVLPCSSLLSGRARDIRTLVRKYLKWVLLVLALPGIVVYGAPGAALELWLGSGFGDAAALLPWIFTAYAVCFLTEPIFRTLQGVGHSGASALAQGIFIVFLGCGLVFWTDPRDFRSVAYPLLAAGAAFSGTNLLFFRRYLQRETAE